MTSVPIRSITPHFKRISAKTVWSFVRVESTDGHIGWGEATINGQAAALYSGIGLGNGVSPASTSRTRAESTIVCIRGLPIPGARLPI